jgi:peptidyl-tRNA hydrolase, PTH1 family
MTDNNLMWIIAGLGNPGRKYARTRHNVGFMVIEEVAERHGIAFTDKKACRLGRGSLSGQDVLLIEPLLYMNVSGPVVKGILRKSNARPGSLIVIHDDLDMETGKLRIRNTGSSGGHKGVESIIQSISSKDFIRIKLGIGREAGIPVEDFVLRKFKRDEISVIKDAIKKAADAVSLIIADGVERAMNKYN